MGKINVIDIRANASDMDVGAFKKMLQKWCKKWTFLLEEGEGGYRHYQGRISLKVGRELGAIKNIWRKEDLLPNYFEPTSASEAKSGECFYQLKPDTKIDGPWSDTDPDDTPEYIPRQYRGLTMYKWQEQISTFEWDKDHCNLLIDSDGWAGKSTVARLNMLHNKAIKLPTHNDAIKLIQSCCNMLMARQWRDPTHIFVDLPRMYDNQRIAGLVSAIEEIKSGYVYDERNKYKDWWFDSPNVWVFTNNDFPTSTLSARRWKVWEISPSGELSLKAASPGKTVESSIIL